MIPFKTNGKAVLAWRQTFFALPFEDRMEKLTLMYYNALEEQLRLHHDRHAFKMTFKFMGHDVCREAFMLLTSLHANVLQKARSNAVAQPPKLRPAGRQTLPRFLAAERAPKYMHCRGWLVSYCQEKADYSPIDDCMWLPMGRKLYYYSLYVQHCVLQSGMAERDIAGMPLFMEMWRTDLPWVKTRQVHSPFTKCSLCEYSIA